jgi:hypothetical protein
VRNTAANDVTCARFRAARGVFPSPPPRSGSTAAGEAARESASGDLGAELGDHLGELFEEANELSERVQELERLAAQVIASPDCVLIASDGLLIAP